MITNEHREPQGCTTRYAKDLKLNLGSITRSTELNEEQLWGTLLASAAATRNSQELSEIGAEAADILSAEAYHAALGAASIMGMNNVFYRGRASSRANTTICAPDCG